MISYPRLKRLISLLLFAVLAVQVSGFTCVGEDLPFSAYGTQAVYQSDGPAHDGHDGDDTGPFGNYGDFDPCPCHLSFTRISPTAVTSFSSFVASLTPSRNHLFIKSISTTIFQPPKILL